MGRVMVLERVMVLKRVMPPGRFMVLVIVQGEVRVIVPGPGGVFIVMPVQGGTMVLARGMFVTRRSTPVRKSSHVIRKLCHGTIETLGD